MAHVDAREGKWRGNWRMEWVASTLHTTSEHSVSSITTPGAHTSAASSRLNWRPRRFKWTRVRFAERRNLVSARVPSHLSWPLRQSTLSPIQRTVPIQSCCCCCCCCYYYSIWICLVTGLFFLVLLLNQQWSQPLRLQASHCSTFRIMCDVPSIAVFCNESIKCFPVTASKFFLKLLVTLLLLLLLLLLFTAIELSLGGSSPYSSTDKQIRINIHKRNNTKIQYKE